jgi:hypothetical protein
MKKVIVGLMVGLGMVVLGGIPAEATLGRVSGYLSPATGSLKVGNKLDVKVLLNTTTNKISVAYINLTIDTTKVRVMGVTVNRDKFTGVYMEKESGGVISLYGTSSKPSTELPNGVLEVGTISLEAVAPGNVTVNLKNYEVTGPSTSSDYSYQLDWQSATFVVEGATPTPITGNGSDGVLKFRTTFLGVSAGAACANNWPVSVTVMNGSESKTYSNISLTADGEEDGKKIYRGEVLLSGFSAKENIAVFLKGPRHIQVKYGKNEQEGFYNTPGGTIHVDSNPSSTPVYDFKKYPMTAGDVTGISGSQDGTVDGLDFSYVKTEVNKRSEGDGMVADLNGNCKLESQDLTLLMLAMKDKMEQLY